MKSGAYTVNELSLPDEGNPLGSKGNFPINLFLFSFTE